MSFNERFQGLGESAMDALSPWNFVKRLFYFLVFGFFLGLQQLVHNLDVWGRSGGGAKALFLALWDTQKDGVSIALGSLWRVVVQPMDYIASSSYGSITFAVISFLLLIAFFFQPVSLFINIVDGRRGQATSHVIRIFSTVVLVLILSAMVFYTMGGETFTSDLTEIQEEVKEQTTTTSDESSVIGDGDEDLIFTSDEVKSVISLI